MCVCVRAGVWVRMHVHASACASTCARESTCASIGTYAYASKCVCASMGALWRALCYPLLPDHLHCRMITDPEGRDFMVEPWPLLSEVPSVETWGPAEKEGAEGHATRDNDSDTEVAGATGPRTKSHGAKRKYSTKFVTTPQLLTLSLHVINGQHSNTFTRPTRVLTQFHLSPSTCKVPRAHGPFHMVAQSIGRRVGQN